MFIGNPMHINSLLCYSFNFSIGSACKARCTMSSLEANTYTAKPTVQVANAITVTKPIVTGNLLSKDSGIQNQQPKRIQPLLKPVIEHPVPGKVKVRLYCIVQAC